MLWQYVAGPPTITERLMGRNQPSGIHTPENEVTSMPYGMIQELEEIIKAARKTEDVKCKL